MPDRKTPKTLVCVIGQVRAAELTWDGFRENVLAALDADLVLAVASGPETAYHRAARFVWPFPEPEDYAGVYDMVAAEMGVGNNWREIFRVPGFWIGAFKESPRPGRAACLYFWRWWLWQHLWKIVDQYDRFVLTRTDLRWKAPHPDLRGEQTIWLPDGEKYGGIPDRHLVTGRDCIREVLRCVECLWREPKAVADEMVAEGKTKPGIDGYGTDVWNVEQAFDFLFQRADLSSLIRYFPYTMFSVRPKDGPTSWTLGEWRDDEGCFVKYPTEYELAMKNLERLERPKQTPEACHA